MGGVCAGSRSRCCVSRSRPRGTGAAAAAARGPGVPLLPPRCSPLPSLHPTAHAALRIPQDLQGPPGPAARVSPASRPPTPLQWRWPGPVAWQHAAGLGRTGAGERGRAEPRRCCQCGEGPAAQRGAASAPPATGIRVLPPPDCSRCSLLPPGAPRTCRASGCSGGACPAPGSAHVPLPGEKKSWRRGYGSGGLSSVAPRLRPLPAPALCLGTLTGDPSPACPQGVPPRGPARCCLRRCPCPRG